MDRTRRIAYMLLLLLFSFVPVIIVPLGGYHDHFYLPKAIALTIIAAAFVSIIYLDRKNLHNYASLDMVNKMLLAYFSMITISLFFAEDFTRALVGRFYRNEGYITILAYFAILLLARYAGSISRNVITGAIAASTIVSAYGIMQYYGFDPIPRDIFRAGWGARAFSTMGNPNFLGSYLVLALPFTYHMFAKHGKKLALIPFAIIFYAMLATNTRSSWIGMTAALIAYWLASSRNDENRKAVAGRFLIVLALTVLTAAAFNMQSGNGLLGRLLSIGRDAADFMDGSDKAGSNRIFIWKKTVELIRMKPFFGFGIENLDIPFARYFHEEAAQVFGRPMIIDKAHNEYLHIAVVSGIPSLMAYLSMIAAILMKGIRRINEDNDMPLMLAAISGYLAQAFFNISVVCVAYMFWAMLGFTAGGYEDKKVKGE